jgi:hypothetical protein
MNDLVFDFAGMVYTYGMFLSYFTFGLFFWWLLKVKTASDVYIYVMLLILGNGISDSFAVVARWLKMFVGIDPWVQFVDSNIWAVRRVPELIILTVIFIRMGMRLRRTLKGIHDGSIIINSKHKDGQTDKETKIMMDDNA